MRNTNTELQKTNAALLERNDTINTSEQNYRNVSAALLQSSNELQFAVGAAGLPTFDFYAGKKNDRHDKWISECCTYRLRQDTIILNEG